jgi:hypothetical protein
MTPFMRRLLFRKGDGICIICNKDRQDTTYHMLNACGKMTRFYTQRHDAVMDRLEEAINMLVKPSGELFKNKIVRIDGKFTNNGKRSNHKLDPISGFGTKKLT